MFWEKVNKLCEEKGIAVSEMCRQLKMSNSIATEWKLRGASPRASTKKKIADFFRVDVSFFDEPNVQNFPLERSVVQIKVYGTIPAGIPVEAVEDIIDTEEIPASWLSGDREYFALQVRGDSMYPQYLEGDVVIFLKTDTCETGDDCVVYVNGQDATLKRIKRYEDGSLSLCPLNTSYSPCTFTAQQVRELPVTIGGVAVELRRKFNKNWR